MGLRFAACRWRGMDSFLRPCVARTCCWGLGASSGLDSALLGVLIRRRSEDVVCGDGCRRDGKLGLRRTARDQVGGSHDVGVVNG